MDCDSLIQDIKRLIKKYDLTKRLHASDAKERLKIRYSDRNNKYEFIQKALLDELGEQIIQKIKKSIADEDFKINECANNIYKKTFEEKNQKKSLRSKSIDSSYLENDQSPKKHSIESTNRSKSSIQKNSDQQINIAHSIGKLKKTSIENLKDSNDNVNDNDNKNEEIKNKYTDSDNNFTSLIKSNSLKCKKSRLLKNNVLIRDFCEMLNSNEKANNSLNSEESKKDAGNYIKRSKTKSGASIIQYPDKWVIKHKNDQVIVKDIDAASKKFVSFQQDRDLSELKGQPKQETLPSRKNNQFQSKTSSASFKKPESETDSITNVTEMTTSALISDKKKANKNDISKNITQLKTKSDELPLELNTYSETTDFDNCNHHDDNWILMEKAEIPITNSYDYDENTVVDYLSKSKADFFSSKQGSIKKSSFLDSLVLDPKLSNSLKMNSDDDLINSSVKNESQLKKQAAEKHKKYDENEISFKNIQKSPNKKRDTDISIPKKVNVNYLKSTKPIKKENHDSNEENSLKRDITIVESDDNKFKYSLKKSNSLNDENKRTTSNEKTSTESNVNSSVTNDIKSSTEKVESINSKYANRKIISTRLPDVQINNHSYLSIDGIKNIICEFFEFIIDNFVTLLTWRTQNGEQNYWIYLIKKFFTIITSFHESINQSMYSIDTDKSVKKTKKCLKSQPNMPLTRMQEKVRQVNERLSKGPVKTYACKVEKVNFCQ